RVVRALAIDGLEVLYRRRVVGRVGERRADLRASEELVGEGLGRIVLAPDPQGRVHDAGERVLTERGDVRVEQEPDGELHALILELELVVLFDDVHEVAAGLHDPEDLRLHLTGLPQEAREITGLVRERRAVRPDDRATARGDGSGERLR